jgi:hypothetical protein
MKNINKDELFSHLGNFLKSKGIDLNEGSYTARIKQGCNLLADAINATQETVSKTKVEVDHALDQLRQTIHEKTAPPPPPQTKTKSQSAPRGKRPTAPPPKKGGTKA